MRAHPEPQPVLLEPTSYQAVLTAPFAALGIQIANNTLHAIHFLPANYPPLVPTCALSQRVCNALERYFSDPGYVFDLPLNQVGTTHQLKVWHALSQLPVGLTATYGQLARQLNSSPRAVGQACGANPLPIIVPCHRVVAAHGRGGFMHATEGAPLDYKAWLLSHESHLRQGA
jgi:methylated-DNA-[protein]-cysteine S-methyltransferase